MIKEELYEALHILHRKPIKFDTLLERRKAYAALKTLIECYFSLIETHKYLHEILREAKNNPPLKFEELKEGMWVWDNKIKQYYQISCVFKDNREMATYGLMNGFILFEENRFYRKQVVE